MNVIEQNKYTNSNEITKLCIKISLNQYIFTVESLLLIMYIVWDFIVSIEKSTLLYYV